MTLVSQIGQSSSDPLTALQLGSSLTTKRTMGRQKLQAELASGSGAFFRAVRRMDSAPATWSGTEGTNVRNELGRIQWQLGAAAVLLAADRTEHAKDGMAC